MLHRQFRRSHHVWRRKAIRLSHGRIEENKRQIIASLTEKGEQFYTEHQRYDESMHRCRWIEIALNRFNEEELQCIFEYEQIMETLLKEKSLRGI